MKLASFDIFDTALIRKCGKPENIFYLLAHRLYPDDRAKREDFLLWRSGAESKARSRRNGREVGLTDIYADSELTGFGEYTSEELMAAEKGVEAENLMVNPAMRELIAKKRKEGYTVCFISDMYLDAPFLTAVLKREACLMGDEQVYVSCEQQARKSSGLLFRHLKMRLEPGEWVHYGDNGHSDVKMAKRAGIKAVKIDAGYTDVEQRVMVGAERLRDRYPLSILAGYSRMVRIAEGGTPEAVLAADFVAPAYIPYVLFILKKAKEQGIKRLYFLSRDSYILLKAAQALHADDKNDIELRYLFVSRQSLMLPYMAETKVENYLAVMDQRTVYRKHVDTLLGQLGTSRQELEALNITFPYNHIATRSQEQDFLHKLFDGAFVPVWQARAEEAQKVIVAYFKQEGLLDGTKSAMVDVGWLGTSRLMMNSLLRRAGQEETDFFYYGTRKDVLPIKYGRYTSYFRAGKLDTELTELLENYFSASPYPTTVGYRQTMMGEIEPEFPAECSFAENAAVKANMKAVERLVPLIGISSIDDEMAYQWAYSSLGEMTNLHGDVDLSPLEHCPAFDRMAFARQFTFSELFLLLFMGRRITAMDKISLYITCGKRLSVPLLWLYDKVHWLQGLIYRKYVYQR